MVNESYTEKRLHFLTERKGKLKSTIIYTFFIYQAIKSYESL